MKDRGDVEVNLQALLTGLIDQQIMRGVAFFCDGEKLLAKEVSDITFLPVLFLSQELSKNLEMGGFGYHFTLCTKPNPFFPIKCHKTDDGQSFFAIAPFLADVFYSHVTQHAHDVRTIFGDVADLISGDTRFGRTAVGF